MGLENYSPALWNYGLGQAGPTGLAILTTLSNFILSLLKINVKKSIHK